LEEMGAKEVAAELEVEVTVQTGRWVGLGNSVAFESMASIAD
jgi:hypothetical protein